MNERPIHVHFVVGAYLPATGYGGPVVKIQRLAPALAKRGVQSNVLTSQLSAPGQKDLPSGWDRQIEPPTRRLKTRLAWRWASWVDLPADLAPPDVLHVIGAWNGLSYQMMRWAGRHNIPYVWEPAGMLAAQGKHRWLKTSLKPLNQQFAGSSRALIWTSQQEQREASISTTNLDNIFRPNAAPKPPQKPMDEKLKFGIDANQQNWGFLGRIADRKGIESLLEAWQHAATDQHLYFAGSPENEHLVQKVRAAGKNVHYLGELDRDNAWAFLRTIDVLVLVPDFGENFGNVVLEAAAVGTPVMCSLAVGAAEYFQDPGIVRLQGKSALIEHVRKRRLPPKPGTLPDMFSADNIATQQAQVYRELLDAGKVG